MKNAYLRVREVIGRISITISLIRKNKSKEDSFLATSIGCTSLIPGEYSDTPSKFNEWVREFKVSFLHVRTSESQKS